MTDGKNLLIFLLSFILRTVSPINQAHQSCCLHHRALDKLLVLLTGCCWRLWSETMQIAAFHSRALEKCLRFFLTFEDLMILLAGINLKHKISVSRYKENSKC